MNRHDVLLDAAIGYVADHGLANLSLRPLAAALGTSGRLLMFHFGNKENLLIELLTEVQSRFQGSLATFPQNRRNPRSTLFQRYWKHLTAPENLKLLRILYEAQFIGIRQPDQLAGYSAKASRDWATVIRSRLPNALRTPELVLLCSALFDGLLIDVLTSGEKARAGRAIDRFAGLLRQAAGGSA